MNNKRLELELIRKRVKLQSQQHQPKQDEISIFHPLLTGWTQPEYDEMIADQQESESEQIDPSPSVQLELFEKNFTNNLFVRELLSIFY